METSKLREKIITLLGESFESKPNVLAYWLGGSDANNESDEYSDLDIFFCVKDGKEEGILKEAQQVLETMGPLDFIENIEYREKKDGQTFHISETPESLLIEIYAIPQSKGMEFTECNPAFKPKIIFDKKNIITFHPLDKEELQRKILVQITEQKNLILQSNRATKYAQRNEYIEATNYYIKYVFLPLVSVLRIKHTPLLHDWLRIHISRHFPKEIVQRLENLMRFASTEDILRNIPLAREWFWEVVRELES